jgi:hypothetical protein
LLLAWRPPPRFPELISQITRLLSNATIELGRIEAADKRAGDHSRRW